MNQASVSCLEVDGVRVKKLSDTVGE